MSKTARVGPEKNECVGFRARREKSLGAVKDLEVRCEQSETNAILRVQRDIQTGCVLPVEPLLVLSGLLNGVSVRVLKDDGCSTNVVSRRFFGLHRRRFHVRKACIEVKHSEEDLNKPSSQVVINGTFGDWLSCLQVQLGSCRL